MYARKPICELTKSMPAKLSVVYRSSFHGDEFAAILAEKDTGLWSFSID